MCVCGGGQGLNIRGGLEYMTGCKLLAGWKRNKTDFFAPTSSWKPSKTE